MRNATGLMSIGRIAVDLQSHVPTVRDAVVKLGIKPIMELNGCPYFSARDFDRLRQHFGGKIAGGVSNTSGKITTSVRGKIAGRAIP